MRQTYADPKAQGLNKASDTDLHAKLVLLTLTFPRVRIIWSSSPYETADIFSDLKQQQDEPDPEKAGLMGADDSPDAKEGIESAFNQTPQEVLRNMPGVTSKNYRYLMNKLSNLEDLSNLDQASLVNLIGVESATQLRSFVDKDSLAKNAA